LQGSRIANTITTNKGARKMTKTFKLTYDESITYEKIIEAKTLEEAKEALALEVVDLSTWQIKDAESQYNNVEEVQ
jgi:hypothetical protein